MNTLMRKLIVVLSKSQQINEHVNGQLFVKALHNGQLLCKKTNVDTEIVPYRFNVQKKEKDTFLEIIRIYERQDRARKGQLQFIETALKYMKEFGVARDIEVYKALFNIFPKGEYVPKNKYQQMMIHYPKHQDTAFSILQAMEENFVIPDEELYDIVANTFGMGGLVMKKVLVMLYWFPKFSQLNPWPLSDPSCTDPKKLAHFAIEKLARADVQADITVYRTSEVSDAIDNTWIISAMSRTQQELLSIQPIEKSLRVEGPFTIWVDKYCIDYFVLKGDPIKREVIYGEYDDISKLQIPFWERHHFKVPVTVHEQDDGVYYAICATGTSSKDSLLSWIRCLQKTNPILEKLPVIFKIKSISSDGNVLIEAGKEKVDVKYISEQTDTSSK